MGLENSKEPSVRGPQGRGAWPGLELCNFTDEPVDDTPKLGREQLKHRCVAGVHEAKPLVCEAGREREEIGPHPGGCRTLLRDFKGLGCRQTVTLTGPLEFHVGM